MARILVDWKQTRPISLSEEAARIGFDFRKFGNLHYDVQRNLKKSVTSNVLKILKEQWDKDVKHLGNKSWFNEVYQGIYVISVAQGFGISYKYGHSEIMYIGRGCLKNRFRSHLDNWIFDMSLSLRDVPFKFYMEELSDGRSPNAFKDLEHWLLETFSVKYGEKPLLNKIAGREGQVEHSFEGNCDAPLSNRGKKFLWTVRPLERNPWFKPTVDA